MDARSLKVFFACALGGGVGSVIAMSIHPLFWWVGLIAGFVLGYFSYEFRQVLWATKESFKVAWNAVRTREFQVEAVRTVVALLVPITVASTLAVLYFALNATVAPFKTAGGHLAGWLVVAILCGSIVTFITLGIAIAALLAEPRTKTKSLFLAVLALTPPGLCVVLVGGSVYSLFWAVVKSPKAMKFCAVFIKTLFKLIHSDVRLLCGVDAAIGAGIGWYFGSPIIGALAGGAIGVANFEILSRRVLRLVKSR